MYIIYEIVYFKNANVFFNKNNLKNVALHSRIIFIEYFLYNNINGGICVIALFIYAIYIINYGYYYLNK